jgi:hypothetical protein
MLGILRAGFTSQTSMGVLISASFSLVSIPFVSGQH